MFKRLLTKSEQVKLQLIESLYDETFAFLEEAARVMGKSQVLLKKYMEELNQEIPFLSFVLSENNQIKFEIDHYHNISHVYIHFLERSEAFKLLELLLSQTYKNYESLAQELSVSQSTVIRLIKEVNICVSALQFKIATRPIRIEGSESHIQQFFTVYLIEKYQGTDFPNQEKLGFGMKEIALYMNQLFPTAPYFTDIQKISILIYIMHVREGLLPKSEPQKNEVKLMKNDEVNQSIKDTFPLHQHKIMEVIERHPATNKKIRLQATKELTHIYQQLFDKFGYTPTNFTEILPKIVFEYLIGMNLKVPYFILNQKLERFKKSRLTFFEHYLYIMLNEIIVNSELEHKTIDSMDNLYYIFCIYFPEFRFEVLKKMIPYRIGLFVDANDAHVAALEFRIKRSLNYPLEIYVINPLSPLSYAKNNGKYDLLISNLSGISQWLKVDYEHFLCIDYHVTAANLMYINQLIDQKMVEQIKKEDRK